MRHRQPNRQLSRPVRRRRWTPRLRNCPDDQRSADCCNPLDVVTPRRRCSRLITAAIAQRVWSHFHACNSQHAASRAGCRRTKSTPGGQSTRQRCSVTCVDVYCNRPLIKTDAIRVTGHKNENLIQRQQRIRRRSSSDECPLRRRQFSPLLRRDVIVTHRHVLQFMSPRAIHVFGTTCGLHLFHC